MSLVEIHDNHSEPEAVMMKKLKCAMSNRECRSYPEVEDEILCDNENNVLKNSTITTNSAIATIWAYNSSIDFVDDNYIYVNDDIVINRVINRFSKYIEISVMDFLEEFYRDKSVCAQKRRKFARSAKVKKDNIYEIFLVGNDVSEILCVTISDVIKYICSNMHKSQSEISFEPSSCDLGEAEKCFLEDKIAKLRESFSGAEISEAFGVEILFGVPRTFSFRDRFDLIEKPILPPERLQGLAYIDGFRDSENAIFLKIIESLGIQPNASVRFLVRDPSLITKALTARCSDTLMHFTAMIVYSAAGVATIYLETLENVESKGDTSRGSMNATSDEIKLWATLNSTDLLPQYSDSEAPRSRA